MKTNKIVLSEQQKDTYTKAEQEMLVKDPWNDPFCNKIGLNNMYIQSTIAEILHLSAELEPGVKQNCPNPVYKMYNELLNTALDSKKVEDFYSLLDFLEQKVVKKEITVIDWSDCDYVPDIRVVDSLEEAMGWVYRYITCTCTK